MTEVIKEMYPDGRNGQEQKYPETHAECVIGLEEFVKKIIDEERKK